MTAFRLQVLPHAERVRKRRLLIGTWLSHRHAGSSSTRALVPEVPVIPPGTGELESDLTDDADENDEERAKDYKGGVNGSAKFPGTHHCSLFLLSPPIMGLRRLVQRRT